MAGRRKPRTGNPPRPWTSDELEAFFGAFQDVGTDWSAIAKLIDRGEKEVAALYDSHSTYLSEPDASVSAFKSLVQRAQEAAGNTLFDYGHIPPEDADDLSEAEENSTPRKRPPKRQRVCCGENEKRISVENRKSTPKSTPQTPTKSKTPAKARTPRTPKRARLGDTAARASNTPQPSSGKHEPVHVHLAPVSSPPAAVKEGLRLVQKNEGMLMHMLSQRRLGYQWCVYEFFYSTLETALLKGNSIIEHQARALGHEDVCSKFIFAYPLGRHTLQTSVLTRGQWRLVRRSMGKPRRFSPAFLAAARRMLQFQKEKIRLLQQGKVPDALDPLSRIQVPEEVPMALRVGDRVTSRLRKTYSNGMVGDVLLTGTVIVVDPNTSTYKVQMENQELGILTFADDDLMPMRQPEAISIDYLIRRQQGESTPNKLHPQQSSVSPAPDSSKQQPVPAMGVHGRIRGGQMVRNLVEDMLQAAMRPSRQPEEVAPPESGWAYKNIVSAAHLNCILQLKQHLVEQLKELNDALEKKIVGGSQSPIDEKTKRHYNWLALHLKRCDVVIEALTGNMKDEEFSCDEAEGIALSAETGTATAIPHFDAAPQTLRESRMDANALLDVTMDPTLLNILDRRSRELMCDCITLLYQIKASVASGKTPARHVVLMLDAGLEKLKPHYATSSPVYRELEGAIACMKATLENQSDQTVRI